MQVQNQFHDLTAKGQCPSSRVVGEWVILVFSSSDPLASLSIIHDEISS